MRRSERLGKQQQINITSRTWNKDSHGLFDYESKNCAIQKFKLWSPDFFVYRHKQTSQITHHNLSSLKQFDIGNQFTLLMRIFTQKCNDGMNYFIGNSQKKQEKKDSQHMHTEESMSNEVAKEDAYLIVTSLKNSDGTPKGHVLQVGQKIKLGRVQYSVIQMKTNDKKEVGQASNYSFFKNQTKYQNPNVCVQQEASCKICMQGITQDAKNFLLNPCKCSGSCKYIHIKCLQNWIFFKVKKQVVGGTAYYHFNKFECQICGQKLPRLIVRNQQTYQLLNIQRPEQSYLILQQIGEDKKDLIVIKNVSQYGLNLGRGHQCQIRINDISVSRQHAKIILKDGRFVILDTSSKFGTLVKLNKNYQIDNNNNCQFQIGRTVLSFSTKKQKINDVGQNMFIQLPATSVPTIQTSHSDCTLKKKKK